MAKLPGPESLRDRPSLLVGGSVQGAKPEPVPRLGAEAEGLSQLARGLGRSADDIASVVVREQERDDKTRAEDAFNKLRNSQLDLTFGAENGFTRAKGGDAANPEFVKQYGSRFDDQTKKLSDGLANDRQREEFRRHAAVAKASFTGDLLRHRAHEEDVYAKGVFQATVDTETRNIGASPRDDLGAGMSFDRVNAAIRREGERLGQTEEQINVARGKAADHLWSARLEAWRLVDPAGALKAFQDNQAEIGPGVRVKLAESLFKDAGPVLAASLNDAGGPPVTANAIMGTAPPGGAEGTPRGIRNNNPGNIVAGETRWGGQIEGSDPRFASFDSPEAGIRALGKNLLTYGEKGIDSVQAIVARWAPATENQNVQEYVDTVAKKLGVNPAEPLNLKDRKVLTGLATAIIEQENGKNPYSPETISSGVEGALSNKPFAYEAKRSPGYSVASVQNMSAAEILNVVTGDPVIDRLPGDQKLAVFQLARTQANQGNSQLRHAMTGRVQDTTAAYERGLDAPNPPSRQELIAVFGQFDGERVAGDMDVARQFGKDVVSVRSLSATQQSALLATRQPLPGDGFAIAEKRHEMLARAIDAVRKERDQDPALSVMRNAPQVQAAYQAYASSGNDPVAQSAAAQAYAAASIAEQQRLQVANPQVLSKDMVDGIAKRFAQPPAQGENVANVMRGMVDQWGKYWPAVGKQLAGKIPPEAEVIGLGVTPQAEQILAETSKLKPEALRQGIPEADQKDIKERVRGAMEPLQRSLAWQSGGIQTYDNFADSAEKIALALVQKGMKPKEAAQKAFDSLAGFKYEFEDGWRVPKTALGGEVTPTMLRAGAEAIKRDVGSDKPVLGEKVGLLVPSAPGSVRPQDAERQWRDTIKANGFWVTSPGDGGLTLYVKSGLGAQPVLDDRGMPVTRSWDQISGIGRATRAAYFSDVARGNKVIRPTPNEPQEPKPARNSPIIGVRG